MIPYLLDKVWIVPAIMAASFLLILFFGKRVGTRATAGIGIVSVSLCLVFSVVVAGQWINRVNHPPTGADLAEDIRQANGLTPQRVEPLLAETEAPGVAVERGAIGNPVGTVGQRVQMRAQLGQ